jgi:phosphatidylinositol alpha-mannosyltransferase
VRIVQVCPYDYYRTGGVQIHIRDLARALAALGHNVTVIAPKSESVRPATEKPDVIQIGKARHVTFNHTRFEVTDIEEDDRQEVIRLFSDDAIDVVHFHTIWVPSMPLYLLKRSRAANIATFHDTPPETLAGFVTRNVFRIMSRTITRRLNAAIAVSEAPARHLWCAPGCTPYILPPCIDLKSYAALAESRESSKRHPRACILFIGRMEKRKGVDILLEAAHKLARTGLHPDILLAGEGELRAELEAASRHRRLDNVHFLGQVGEEEKHRLLSIADIFCAPSPYGESFGIVLVEAMAAGLPVVAAGNAGYRSTLAQTGGGLLAHAADAADMAQCLAKLLQYPDLRRKLAYNGRHAALMLNAREQAPRFLAIYEEALKGKEARSSRR